MAEWETDTLDYDRLHPRVEVIAALVKDAKPRTVLELGCSTGNLRSLLGDVEYWGCDVSTAAVARHDDPHVVVADLNDGIPHDGPFDVIVGSGILEYVDDLPLLFRQAHDRLNVGGRLVVSYVNDGFWQRRVTRRRGGVPTAGHVTWRPIVPPGEFRQMARAAGFGGPSVHVYTLLAPRVGTLPRWLHRIPGRRLLAMQLVYVFDRR